MKIKILPALAVGVLLLGACKGSGSKYEAINNNSSADSASVGRETMVDTSLSVQPKLVKSADMRFKVKNVQQTAEKITALAVKNAGMVMHHQMESSTQGSRDYRISDDSVRRVSAFNTSENMTIKVPSDKLEDFMYQVAHMGTHVTFSKMDIEDKSLDFLSAKLKLNSRKELVDQQKKGKITIKNPLNVLLLKDDMVDGQIDNLKIDAAVKFSVITLNFYESNTIIQETIANDDPSAYQLPFGKRLFNSLAYGWFMFTELVLALANLWVFVLATIGLIILFRYYKRKHPSFFGTIKS
ncbi:DUF4349 domain-containing protein [Mucilaginibacter dorajii]|uniref:DUF4349 domain-containing protein n=1 Tax=Mucilaginibacter dorajii TaxID=692994 RepID=A0ABP7QUM3_9SPHI|nr:DUF4349 domain-containing protein [Mucilaginibacter dorajii]MCS3735810.1 hypothetical protein [Mucilaginibacter dorajii]